MKVDAAGWLEVTAEGFPAVLKIPSVRSTALDVPEPMGLVWHWTGGRCGSLAFGPACANEIRTYVQGKDRPASWHVLVCRDGRILQSIDFGKGSWHVGRPGKIGARMFGNVNKGTVGVELENAGRLEKVDGKFYCWPFWANPDSHEGQRVPDPKLEIAEARASAFEGQFFDNFPEAQEMAATRLLSALAVRFKWAREASGYGHSMFDSPRKEDPGPLWLKLVLPRILDRTFGSSAH